MSVHDPIKRARFKRGDARIFRFVIKKLARQPPPCMEPRRRLPRCSRVLSTSFVNSQRISSLRTLDASGSAFVPDAACSRATAFKTREFNQRCVDFRSTRTRVGMKSITATRIVWVSRLAPWLGQVALRSGKSCVASDWARFAQSAFAKSRTMRLDVTRCGTESLTATSTTLWSATGGRMRHAMELTSDRTKSNKFPSRVGERTR